MCYFTFHVSDGVRAQVVGLRLATPVSSAVGYKKKLANADLLSSNHLPCHV